MRLIAVIAAVLLCSCALVKKAERTCDELSGAAHETKLVMADWHAGGTNNAAQAAVRLITDTNKREKSITDLLVKIGLAILGLLGIFERRLSQKWNERKERIRCSRKHKRN